VRLVPPLEEPPDRRLEDPDLLLEPLDEPLRLLLLLRPLARFEDELPRLEAEERLRAELLEPFDEPLRLLLLLLRPLPLARFEDELPRLEAEERLRAERLEPEGLRRLCWEP
jgi:hypothetical protein